MKTISTRQYWMESCLLSWNTSALVFRPRSSEIGVSSRRSCWEGEGPWSPTIGLAFLTNTRRAGGHSWSLASIWRQTGGGSATRTLPRKRTHLIFFSPRASLFRSLKVALVVAMCLSERLSSTCLWCQTTFMLNCFFFIQFLHQKY